MSLETTQVESLDNLPPGKSYPGDANARLLLQLRSGDYSSLHDEDDNTDEVPHVQSVVETHTPRRVSVSTDPNIPDIIKRLLRDPIRCKELEAAASFIEESSRKNLTLVFHTDIGDVRSSVAWSNHTPRDLVTNSEDLIIIQLKKSDMSFVPKPGSNMRISFLNHEGSTFVTCISKPQTLYQGIDLIAFLPSSDPTLEKQGVLKEGAPSVESGKPSNAVDANGEPVTEAEKAASEKAAENFDKVRG